ncbi:hypothetical protein ACOJIU_15385 [Carnobacterium maltaromaticum]|uniref:hypothetical protein n=1 Tax=Carnobacterium maltaromaticum TaxID=2751 RepID=UPI003B9818BF
MKKYSLLRSYVAFLEIVATLSILDGASFTRNSLINLVIKISIMLVVVFIGEQIFKKEIKNK